MSGILDRLRREPVLLSQVVAAGIALAASFGLSLSVEQTAAVMGVCQLIAAVIGRSQVTPTSVTAAEQTDTGTVAGPAADGIPEGAPVEVVSSDTKADAAYHDPKHAADE